LWVFAITNAKKYYKNVEEDLADLAAEIANSSRAINAVTSTSHIYEWLWARVSPIELGRVRLS
jgi:hypothetical protein